MSRTISAQWSQLQRKLSGLSNSLPDHHGAGQWMPNTDVCESADDLVVKMELAGVPKESVRIAFEGDQLIVEGFRREPYGGESTAGYRFHQVEIEYGPFRRVMPIPFAVDGEKTRARIENGILRIVLPRARSSGCGNIVIVMES